MNGFFKWFSQKTGIKRWLFLSLIGVFFICYGIANLIVLDKLQFIDVAKLGASFVFGVVLIVTSLVFIQKRTLELLIEESYQDEEKSKTNVKSLIFNKKVYNQGPKIVVIGGGAGINTVLKGLKNYTDNITAIVTISDYGKIPTTSRTSLNMLPLGDIKESFVSLANDEKAMELLLRYTFDQGKLKDLSFSDIYFSAMHGIYGDFTKAIEKTKEVLEITGRVLPVTLEEMKICAELEDGTIIEERAKIPEIVSQKASKINRVYINPNSCRPAPGVLEAIAEADAIIIGPGSLYTNIIPNLLVKGLAKAIREAKGHKVYVSNIMTELGQTDEYTLSDHIRAINDYVGRGVIDYCIYDTGEIVPEFIMKYNLKGADVVTPDLSKAKEEGVRLIQRDLSYIEGENIVHDPDVIASSIIELICDELKFRDMQNDSQYIMLHSKLKDSKKKMKQASKNDKTKEENKKGKAQGKEKGDSTDSSFDEKYKFARRTSKFSEKYKERMDSIHESEMKRKAKEEHTKKQKEKTK